MNRRKSSFVLFVPLVMIIGWVTLSPGEVSAEEPPKFTTGLDFGYWMRTITWDDEAEISKLKTFVVALREDIRLGSNSLLSLQAGLALSSPSGMIFRNLPVSLEYDAGPIKSLALGAEFRALLFGSGEFEIEGVGRIVSSLGFTKTWPLEGFAVDGEARGRPFWFEASLGPRISYTFFGGFRPYVFVFGSYLSGNFKMDEILEDLRGTETIAFKGKSVIGVAFGAILETRSPLSFRAEAGFFPYQGGVDAKYILGFSYAF